MDPNAKLQQATESLLERLGNSTLKPLRKKCFQCAANCCDTKGSMQQFQQCVANCDAPAQQAEQLLSQELDNFQRRLHRCAMDCKDNAQDKIPADPAKQTPALMDALNLEVTACANKCVDESLSKLGGLETRFMSAAKNM